MSTAAAPATTAPTIGTKAATNVSTASGSTSGMPTAAMPRPMNTASTVATRTTPRM
jgi:hypothetical protein